MKHIISPHFPKYEKYDPKVPVWCVTPSLGRTIHRFFDTSPFSPSGRYLGLTRLPFEDRLPAPGDVAEIVLVDLMNGQEQVVAETYGWDTQLGAQVQWGATDNELLFNDVDAQKWEAFGVVLDPSTGSKRRLDGTVYMVTRDGKWAISPSLLRIGATQPGYGVHVPVEHIPRYRNVSSTDGIYITDITSGKSRLLVSLKEIVEAIESSLRSQNSADGEFFAFHVKWNNKSDRLMMVLRWLPFDQPASMRSQVVTMNADGSGISIAIPAEAWSMGGHHPNWCPDGESVMMNLKVHRSLSSRVYSQLPMNLRSSAQRLLKYRDNGMRLVRARYDGNGLQAMHDAVIGTGHPTMHPNGRQILTDAYLNEPYAHRDGTTPIRLIDIDAGIELELVRINTNPSFKGPRNELRVDAHPAWDYQFQRIAFNAWADGTRRVYVADLKSVLV